MEFVTGLPATVGLYVVPALIVLTAVVFVHEMGHFLVARWCGIRVAAFSIGFGREVAGFTDRHGTRWKLSLIPLGGYVRFEGDDNAASAPDLEMLEATPPEERQGLFHFAALWRRIAVVAAGPAANFLLAVVVFASVFALIGRPHILPIAQTVIEGSAAERAGFQPGDRIISVDGEKIESFTDLQSMIMLSAGDTLSIVVERDGKQLSLTAVPERKEQPDRLGGSQRIGVLGITSGAFSFERDPPLTALSQGVHETGQIVDRTLTYIGRLLSGRESADQLSGPIRIGQMSGEVAIEWRDSWADLSDRGAFGVDRPVQSVPGADARWGAPFVLFHRGVARQAAQRARAGYRLPHRLRPGDHAVHFRHLQRYRQLVGNFRELLVA